MSLVRARARVRVKVRVKVRVRVKVWDRVRDRVRVRVRVSTMSLKSILDQQFTHFLSSAALCTEAVGFSMALCAAVAAASVITCSG